MSTGRMDVTELKEALKKMEVFPMDIYHEEIISPLTSVGLFEIIKDESAYGCDYSNLTVYFKDHDIYLKTYGEYSSYYGTQLPREWGDQVHPKEITITIYE